MSLKLSKKIHYSLQTYMYKLNPIALRKAKIVYNFGLSECNRVKEVTSVT